MKISKISIIQSCMFVLNPIISIIFIFIGILQNKKSSYFLFCIILGIAAYLLVPYSEQDLVRHYERFDLLKELNLKDILKGKDLYLDLVIIYIKKWNLNKEILPFITVFLSYTFLTKIYLFIIKKNNLKLPYIIFILSTISFNVIALGIRSGLATTVFIYGVYLIYEQRSKIGYIYILASPLIHFSFIINIFVVLIFNLFKNKISIKNFYLSLIIGLLLNPIVINKFLTYFDVFSLKQVIDVYTIGYWSNDYLKYLSFKGKIVLIFEKLKYMMIIIYISIGIKENSNLKKFLILLSSVSNLFINLPIIYGRYMLNINCLVIIVLYIQKFQLDKVKNKFVNKLFICMFFLIIFSNILIEIVSQKDSYLESYKSIITKNIVTIFKIYDKKNFILKE